MYETVNWVMTVNEELYSVDSPSMKTFPEPCESDNFKNISIVKSNILILVVVQTAFLKTVNKTAKKF